MKQVALIGPTASGKSALAIELACKFNAFILSLDSLSVYREIDIASAKPSLTELVRVKHFGINEIFPNEHFNTALFFELYKKAKSQCDKHSKNLIIVGGTGFYLYSMTNGLSNIPPISETSLLKARESVLDIESAYSTLQDFDPKYAEKISSNDTYRIQKAYEIYFETNKAPSEVFAASQKEPICPDLPIFEIAVDRVVLRERIRQRTQKMLADGLLSEVEMLLAKYGREPKSMKSIGISEIIDHIDGKTTLPEALELISIHTGQLAKRQETFNKSKFPNTIKKSLDEIGLELENFFKN